MCGRSLQSNCFSHFGERRGYDICCDTDWDAGEGQDGEWDVGKVADEIGTVYIGLGEARGLCIRDTVISPGGEGGTMPKLNVEELKH